MDKWIKGPKDLESEGRSDQVTKGPIDQGTRDQWKKGPRDEGTKGPMHQGTNTLRDQGNKASRDVWFQLCFLMIAYWHVDMSMDQWTKGCAVPYVVPYDHRSTRNYTEQLKKPHDN